MSSLRLRRQDGWVPRQHGAWAMLAAPAVLGIATARPSWVQLPLVAFWFVGYMAFFAASQWLKSGFRRRYRPAATTYAAASALLGAWVLLVQPGLLRCAWWFVPPAAVGLWAAWRRQERSWWAGLATVVAAGLFAPTVHMAGGHGSPRIWVGAAVLTAYLCGTVLFVKSMIRERDNAAFRRVSVAVHALAVALAAAFLPWWVALAFGGLALRAAALPRRHLTPLQVGMVELAGTAVMTAVAVAVV